MKNIEMQRLNLEELTRDEQKEIQGGWAPLIRVGVGLAIAAGTEIIRDWDNFKRGLSGQPEVPRQ